MKNSEAYNAGLYCRLSKDDDLGVESSSIGTQRAILRDYCTQHNYSIYKVYIDDGYSGMNFNRPGFRELLEDVESGTINMVITKDLSRLGRDYIMTGYYSEIFFPAKGIRYIAISDDFDSAKMDNDIAPFKNILNDMYARDISRKIKTAKHQRAKQGLCIASQAPYGYRLEKNRLYVDPEAAEVVTLIFSLAEEGLGNIAIASALKERKIVTPSVYKYQRGDRRFLRYPAVKNGEFYTWSPATLDGILKNQVYTGVLERLKTQTLSCKTKQRTDVLPENRIVTPNAHQAIISREQFDAVQGIRAKRFCSANTRRFNLFRSKLFCSCCGHPLSISRKQLLNREADIYLCMHHYINPTECPQTHRVYHDMLYPYVLQQVRLFAKGMKRRKINSSISNYAEITELTPEILQDVIDRIEIDHVTHKSRPGKVIHIYWRLK